MALGVDASRCVRCAACAVAAPGLFEVTRKGTVMRRQPSGEDDVRAAAAAMLVCPAQAIIEAEQP